MGRSNDPYSRPFFRGAEDSSLERGANRLLAKQSSLVIPNTNISALENWIALCIFTGHLVYAL